LISLSRDRANKQTQLIMQVTEEVIDEAFGIEIESNICVPERQRKGRRGPRQSKYPVAKLEAGQSFWVPKSVANSARGTAARHKKLNPDFDYTARTEDRTDAEGVVHAGVRVFRTK